MAEEADVFGMNPGDAGPSEHGEGEPPSAPPAEPAAPETTAPTVEAGAPAAETDQGAAPSAPEGDGAGAEANLIMGRWERNDEGYAQLEAAHYNLQAYATREAQQRVALETEIQRLLAGGPPQAGPMPGGFPAPLPGQQVIPGPQASPYGANGAAPAVELVPVPNFEDDPNGYATAVQENARRTATAAAATETARAQQEYAAATQQQAAEQQRAVYLSTVETTLGQWRSEHSIAPNSPQEVMVAQVCQGYGFPLHDRAALDFALEMTQNPQLASAARTTTEAAGLGWTQTPEGRAYVRKLVPSAPGSPPGSAAHQQAFLEHGGSGAPIPGAPGSAAPAPHDPWDRAVAYGESRRQETSI